MGYIQEGYRIGLREANTLHCDEVLEIFSQPGFMDALPFCPPSEKDKLLKLLESEDRSFRIFLAYQKKDDFPIGLCEVKKHSILNGTASIAFGIKDKVSGMRMALEMLDLTVNHLFQEEEKVELLRLEAEVLPDNHKAQRVLNLVGFHHEGTLRQSRVLDGKRIDIQIWGLLQNDLMIGENY